MSLTAEQVREFTQAAKAAKKAGKTKVTFTLHGFVEHNQTTGERNQKVILDHGVYPLFIFLLDSGKMTANFKCMAANPYATRIEFEFTA